MCKTLNFEVSLSTNNSTTFNDGIHIIIDCVTKAAESIIVLNDLGFGGSIPPSLHVLSVFVVK